MKTATTRGDTVHEAVQGIASAATDTGTGHGRVRDAETTTKTTAVGIDLEAVTTEDETNDLSGIESGVLVTSDRGHAQETDGKGGTGAGRHTRASKRGETEVTTSLLAHNVAHREWKDWGDDQNRAAYIGHKHCQVHAPTSSKPWAKDWDNIGPT
jgi:hypothetical protein